MANELLHRHDEPRIEVVEQGRLWSFDGAGKTIMAGLLIKELIARGDLQRCLIVCPGSLAEQWQDELYQRFHLPFEILTNDKLEAARTGNFFLETNLVIARLDKLSRNEDVQAKLSAPDCHWDLVVCDEAHKMSASAFGGEIRYTKRYRLGQLLSTLTRHFLLLTATPHNGKEEDFQLFMALLDGDRFEGRYRDGVHQVDVSDLMRRMVKENLLKFDAIPLSPERIAYERIAFEKALVAPPGQPLAAFICPGHPLPDAVIDLTLERHCDLLRRGTTLVDERDPGTQPRVLFYLEHAIQDASLTRSGERRVISRRMLYVELDASGHARTCAYAPYLDLPPARPRRAGRRCHPDPPGVRLDYPRPFDKPFDRLRGNLRAKLGAKSAGLRRHAGGAGVPGGGARGPAGADR